MIDIFIFPVTTGQTVRLYVLKCMTEISNGLKNCSEAVQSIHIFITDERLALMSPKTHISIHESPKQSTPTEKPSVDEKATNELKSSSAIRVVSYSTEISDNLNAQMMETNVILSESMDNDVSETDLNTNFSNEIDINVNKDMKEMQVELGLDDDFRISANRNPETSSEKSFGISKNQSSIATEQSQNRNPIISEHKGDSNKKCNDVQVEWKNEEILTDNRSQDRKNSAAKPLSSTYSNKLILNNLTECAEFIKNSKSAVQILHKYAMAIDGALSIAVHEPNILKKYVSISAAVIIILSF